MNWNYRIFAIPDQDEWWYYISEAYYDDEGNVSSWSTNPSETSGLSIEGLTESHKKISRAFDKPVIYLNKVQGKIIKEDG